MYSYNPDRKELSEVKLLSLEPWRLFPKGDLDRFVPKPPANLPKLTKQSRIASIGSCFAREIKNWLEVNGYNYLSFAEGPCSRHGSARYERVYNTYTLKQEFMRALGQFSPSEKYWEFKDRDEKIHLLDPHRKNVAWESEYERKKESAEHADNCRKAFSEPELLVVTVGQAEIWYNKKDGYVYPLVPPPEVYNEQMHGFRLTTYEENIQNLQYVVDAFTKLNPNGHILITLSPVPLRATFRDLDSVIANSSSKAILRAAVDNIVTNNINNVIYFPAYEVVTQLEISPFKEDNRHVRPEVVERIMKMFEYWFI